MKKFNTFEELKNDYQEDKSEIKRHENVENFIELLKNGMINITTEIEKLVEEMGGNPSIIIHGNCGEFADRLIKRLGGETSDLFIITPNSFDNDENSFNYTDSNNPRFYKKFGKIPKGIKLDELEYIDHSWIYYNGKHYDAMTKYGVKEYKDLDWFKINLPSMICSFKEFRKQTPPKIKK